MLHIAFDESCRIAKEFLAINGDLLELTKKGKAVLDGEPENMAVESLAAFIRSHYQRGVTDAADKIRNITDQLAEVGIYQNIQPVKNAKEN